MKKVMLATFSVVALLALPGCCKDKKKAVKPDTCMKKEDCCTKGTSCKKDKCHCCHKHHKGKKCSTDKSKKMSRAYLDLEPADDLLA